MMNRQQMILSASALLLAPRAAIAQPALESVTAGVLPAEIAAEMFYGKDAGIFAKHGLDVQLSFLPNGGAIAAAIAGGAIDIGLADVLSVSNAHSRGIDILFLAPGLVSSEVNPTFGILVKGDSTIREAKDFNGATVAVSALNSISQVPMQAWVDNNGGNSKTIKFIEIPIPAMGAAVANGTVTAAVPTEPFLAFGVQAGDRVMLMQHNTVAPEMMVSGWTTTRAWIQKHPQTAARLAAAIREVAQWSNANRAASSPILAKYAKIPEAVIARMRRANFAENFDAAKIQPVIDAGAKYGTLPKSFPATEIMYRA